MGVETFNPTKHPRGPGGKFRHTPAVILPGGTVGKALRLHDNGRVEVYSENKVTSGATWHDPADLVDPTQLKDFGQPTKTMPGTKYKESDKDLMEDFGRTSFRSINQRLRKGKVKPGGWHTNADADEMIAKTDDVMTRSTVAKPVTVHRTMGTSAMFAKLQPGDEFTDKGFVSTSMDRDSVVEFHTGTYRSQQQGQFAEIAVPAGTHGYYGTGAVQNYELTLDRGLTFRVTGVREEPHGRVLSMEVVSG